VPFFSERASMFLLEWIIVRSSCGAALSKISELVNMDTMLAVGTEAFDRAGNLCGRVYIVLTEGGDSSDSRVVVGIENADGVPLRVWNLILIKR